MATAFGLSKFKKVIDQVIDYKYFEYIIVGHDKYCVKAAEILLKKNPTLSLLVIREEIDDLFGDQLCTLRGKENIQALEKLNFKLEEKASSVFYKDLTFYNFGKRAKSNTLKNTEPFFIQPSVQIDTKSDDQNINDNNKANNKYLSFETTWEELSVKYFNLTLIDVPVLKIEKTTPNDLLRENHYQFELTNNTFYSCKNMICGHSPFWFLNKLENKAILNDDFIQFCETTRGPMSLSVKFKLDTDKFYQDKTFFIPLSYTHEWGHFIGEFLSKNEVLFVHYVGDEGLLKQDVEKRIRLLKRQLDKAFYKFEEYIQELQVKFEEESASQNIVDSINKNDIPEYLTFVGENSYLENNDQKNISNFVRGILSIDNLGVWNI